MIHFFTFTDEELEAASEWLDTCDCEFKLNLNDKIVIYEASFQSSLFEHCWETEGLTVVSELNSIATKGDQPESHRIGTYFFYISDIHYWADAKGGVSCFVKLSKHKPIFKCPIF